MKAVFLGLLLMAVAAFAASDNTTQLYSSINAPRVSPSTGYVDFWKIKSGPGRLISLYGYNSGPQQFVQVFDTNGTNAFISIPGWSAGQWFTNSPAGALSTGEAIQFTNTVAAVAAGIYWVSVLDSNIFQLNSSRAKALQGTGDLPPSGASAAAGAVRLPIHSFTVAGSDNYSVVVQDTGIGFARGLLVGNSTTGGTYTQGATNITVTATVANP